MFGASGIAVAQGTHTGIVSGEFGGDTITARFMRAEFFEFRPQFKLWLATNHKPVIKGSDEAIWDRIRLIPFTVRIPEAQQDKNLILELRLEGAVLGF